MTPRIAAGPVSWFFLLTHLYFLPTLAAFPRAEQSIAARLEAGRPIENVLAGGQTQRFGVVLQKKQYASIVFEQRGVDLVITLYGPDDAKLFVTGLTERTEGQERVRFIASTSGEYRLEARTADESAPAGNYTIGIEELRQASLEDETRIAAQTAYLEAMQLIELPQAELRRKIISLAETALPLYHSLNDRRGEADSRQLLAFAHSTLGDKRKALEFYAQELRLRREIKDVWGESLSLANHATIYIYLGDMQKAMESFRQALPLLRELRLRSLEAVALNNLGALYKLLGDQRQSLNYFNEALPILRLVKDRKGQSIALNNLGQLHSAFGEREEALDCYRQALDISHEIKDAPSEAIALHNMGLIFEAKGETQNALERYNRALPIFRTVGDRYLEASTLAALGELHRALGDLTRGTGFLEQALSLSKATGNRPVEATTQSYLARVERDRGNLAAAREHANEALSVIEVLRGKIGSGGLRASYLATAQDYYEFAVDLYMQSHRQNSAGGFDAAALETNERAIARSLLDSLAEANADIRNGVDPKLLERERELENQLRTRTQSLARLRGASQQQAATINQEIEKLIAERGETQTAIRQASPRYAALTQPIPLSLREIQQQTLGDETILLEYSLGKDRSYLWMVTPTSIKSFDLPKRETIEGAARRVYENMSAASAASEHALELSRMLLGPVAGDLGKKRLLIVAGGALQYIPFAALSEPGSNGQRGPSRRAAPSRHGGKAGARPLIVNHEIVYLPSASTLGVLRREFDGRPAAPKQLAVFADPVFDRNDLRVKSASAEPSVPAPAQTPSRSTGSGEYDRLRSTRREAEEIIAFSQKSESLLALDFEANRARVAEGDLNDYRILHFATHGLLDAERPELSGLVFSMVDEKGAPQNGYLRAHEVYNLKFSADLVVLSGCRTALGKDVRGEGLLGLTRGFMYAGAPRVMASLWQVPDKATAELMKRYYQNLLVRGLSPAAALRAAQASILQEKQWAAPYYWAAFVLQGEWK